MVRIKTENLLYKLVLGRWYFSYGWVWFVGFILGIFSMLVTIYYLIPGMSTMIAFRDFLIVGGLVLVALNAIVGYVLVKVMKVQSMEIDIGTQLSPYSSNKLTEKEGVWWSAIRLLMEKEYERKPDPKLMAQMKLFDEYLEQKRKFDLKKFNDKL
ncbi:MAG: hypothetical protein OEZ48_07575 [Candidatus Bathyarchaeota archaeon]|nr:hypothetical protein [Candidatus Bathyarchaeota archaeon]MDH5687705.1 hypothetical protein [Candidatus Bathyarchaeota archaeon]